ncbi:MAG: MFS transporter, partial [Candidatus Dormibacteraeota bacterium]|nr:MFS transporter [Candidatus Dormibacteraeota bacterium]
MALAVQTAISVVAAALAVLLPFVKDEFRLTYAEAGIVVNFSFVGGFLTIALAGLVVDALGDRFVLVLGGLLAGAAAMAAAISPNFWVLLVVLAVMGVGVATPTPAGSVAVRRAFPLRLRGMVMSIRQTG